VDKQFTLRQRYPNSFLFLVTTVAIVVAFLVPHSLAINPVSAESTTGQKWRVPSRKAKKVNPITMAEESLAIGSKLYHQECLECHGKTGNGDGPEAANLEEGVTDFADSAVWQQSDGALYFKISVGRRPMPGFKKLLSGDERWHLINYVRNTFGRSKTE
jgi:mono/diheme cytochrome c family protein